MQTQEKHAQQITQVQAEVDDQANLNRFAPVPLSATQTAKLTVKVLIVASGLGILFWLIAQS